MYNGGLPTNSSVASNWLNLEHLNNEINVALNDNKFVLSVATDMPKAFVLVECDLT